MTEHDNAIMQVAEFMRLAAATAPKTRGQDVLDTMIITGSEKNALADELDRLADDTGLDAFNRDSKNVRGCPCVVLFGFKNPKPSGLNCHACGADCSTLEPKTSERFDGPTCAFRMVDLGIALGSAAKTASTHNADNRVMYTAGLAAKRLKLLDSPVVVAIVLTADAKNPFFDR
jgi:uncharacterized ferredoxin-like protein